MIVVRCLPFVLFATLGCKLDNPAFEGDDELGDASGTGKETGSEGKETGSSIGESSDPTETSESPTGESTSSNDGVDTSSSSSDTFDTSSSSDTFDTSSSSDTFDTSSSSEGVDTSSDGLDAPINLCPIVEPEDSCFTCIQNHCCEEADVACILDVDDLCNCTLACVAEGGDPNACSVNCGVGQLVAAHAEALFQCGVQACPNLCIG